MLNKIVWMCSRLHTESLPIFLFPIQHSKQKSLCQQFHPHSWSYGILWLQMFYCDSWAHEDKIDQTLLPIARIAWHLKHAAKSFRPTDIETCNLQQLHTGFAQLQMHYAFKNLRSPHAKNIPNWQLKRVAALNTRFSSVQGVASWVAAPTASQRCSG